MSDGIYCALSGALAQSTALDATATNLANASTTGYRTQTPIFREVLQQAGKQTTLRYAAVQATATSSEAGALRSTGRDLDVALPDKVFLAIQADGGERYTRAGSLQVRPDGTITTRDDRTVLAENDTPIKVPPGGVPTITADGEVRTAEGSVARLKLVTFAEPAWMVHEGSTLLAATTDSGAATPAAARLTVGALEDSNASPVTAMTEMMTATRMFEAFQRAIETFHEIDRRVATTTAGVT